MRMEVGSNVKTTNIIRKLEKDIKDVEKAFSFGSSTTFGESTTNATAPKKKSFGVKRGE